MKGFLSERLLFPKLQEILSRPPQQHKPYKEPIFKDWDENNWWLTPIKEPTSLGPMCFAVGCFILYGLIIAINLMHR